MWAIDSTSQSDPKSNSSPEGPLTSTLHNSFLGMTICPVNHFVRLVPCRRLASAVRIDAMFKRHPYFYFQKVFPHVVRKKKKQKLIALVRLICFEVT